MKSTAIFLPYAERAATAFVADLPSLGVFVLAEQSYSPSLATSAEVMHVPPLPHLIRRVGNLPLPRRYALAGMHWSKVAFATAAGRMKSAEVVVGMPGACLEIFTRAPSAVKVFHAVDAHPDAHNAALLSSFSRREAIAELYPPWLVRRIRQELELASVILTPSRVAARGMVEFGVHPSKIRIEPYGVDFGMFDGRPSEEKPPPNGRARALYVGQVSMRKGISILVEAARGADVDIDIVGNVFDRRILKNLPSNIHVHSPRSHMLLRGLYERADAFVIPSVEDACSLVALEAAASGLPVIGTRANGAMELLDRGPHTTIDEITVDVLRARLEAVTSLSIDARLQIASDAKRVITDWSQYSTRFWSAICQSGQRFDR